MSDLLYAFSPLDYALPLVGEKAIVVPCPLCSSLPFSYYEGPDPRLPIFNEICRMILHIRWPSLEQALRRCSENGFHVYGTGACRKGHEIKVVLKDCDLGDFLKTEYYIQLRKEAPWGARGLPIAP